LPYRCELGGLYILVATTYGVLMPENINQGKSEVAWDGKSD